ncbi:MAG: hypothetical protein ACM3NF_01205 [Gemmatimonadota bacterium]
MRIRWPFALAIVFASGAARAQDLSVLLGRMEAVRASESSACWQVDFRYHPARHISLSASYLNEGHVPDHKRDGIAAQLWGRIPLFARRVALSLGGGPYYYFDTTTRADGSFADVHGWAGIYSASVDYYARSPWFARLAVNHIKGGGDFDANTYLAGVGYRLWKEEAREAGDVGPQAGAEPSRKTGDEVMLFAGQTVANSLKDQKGIASGIEFRTGLAAHIDWTLTWLNESNPEVVRRNGLGSQAWVVDSYLDDRLVIGAGGGGYYFLDTKRPPATGQGGTRELAFLLSLTAGYRFADHWFVRFNWNRVLAEPNRDTDVFVLGAGFRWKE